MVNSKTQLSADLPQAIETAIERISDQTIASQTAVVATYPAHLPTVQISQDDLVRVIVSLISAALATVDSGEVRIRAEMQPAREASGPGDEPEVPVPLTGGPWAIVSLIFPRALRLAEEELLKRLETPLETLDQSQGLWSFAECKQVLEGYTGSLWMGAPGESEAGIYFSLPLKAVRLGESDISEVRRVVEAHLPGDGEPEKTILLVVEDDSISSMLSNDLVEAGFRVIVTDDGAEVIALARSEQPDLILLDLLVREPSAFDIAMVLKQDSRTLPIPLLFLSSVDDPLEGVRMKAANFVVRSHGTGALLSTIQLVLNAGISPSGRVMVVDKRDTTREMLNMMIQGYGYKVTEATGPEEALVLAERFTPELILVNAEVARDRDYWLLRGLRQLDQSFEIIVMADRLTEAEGRAAVRRGASGFSDTGKLSEVFSQRRRAESAKEDDQ
jgi:DNA-binding response OmpR family regulator